MSSPTICNVAIPTPLRRTFDYLLPAGMPAPKPGCRVKVSFGRRSVIGIVVGLSHSSEYPLNQLKPIITLLDSEPLIPEALFKVYLWTCRYYHHPVGDALHTMFPAALREENPPAPLVKAWQLTTAGKGLPTTALSRAPKQQTLLNLVQQHPQVSTVLLKQQGISNSIVKALRDKGLIEQIALSEQVAADTSAPLLAEPSLPLNNEQQLALDQITLEGFSCTLLQGETGSGKTEVYLQLIEKVIASGKQALMLIPEINLTPQTLSRFTRRFNCPVAMMHSGMTNRERLQSWNNTRQGQASILIGTRSSVFTPMQNPGIMVIDEEHDSSFKQQTGLHYSARDLAVVRAKQENIPVILGSATPSLESLHNCQQGRYHKVVLQKRHGLAAPPQWQLVDLLDTSLKSGISATLINSLKDTLSQGNQALIFLNRRGYAPRMSCNDCAWIAECSQCTARYTVHQRANRLICHHCEKVTPIPKQCPGCHSPRISLAGQGTERIEETLTALFPNHPVYRIDRDSTRKKQAMNTLLRKIHQGESCILVGTQMLAKGHHFPNVTLTAMLDVDHGLFSPDFRAAEKMGQLITQVAGRCGRGDKPGKVIIQSQYCDHPLLTSLVKDGYITFGENQLAIRQATRMPPFNFLAIIRAEASTHSDCEGFLNTVKTAYQQISGRSETSLCIGPLPSVLERKKGQFRYQLSFLDNNRQRLQQVLSQLTATIDQQLFSRKVRWTLDIDPVDSI